MYFDQRTHAWACVHRVKNNEKHLKIIKKVLFSSYTRETQVRLTQEHEWNCWGATSFWVSTSVWESLLNATNVHFCSLVKIHNMKVWILKVLGLSGFRFTLKIICVEPFWFELIYCMIRFIAHSPHTSVAIYCQDIIRWVTQPWWLGGRALAS